MSHSHDVTIFLQSRRIRKLAGSGSTIRVEPLSTHYRRAFVLETSSFGLELWEKHFCAIALRPKLTLFMTSATVTPALQRVA